jgi:hypothetical protein
MMGTFGGALEARQIDASNGKLTADVTGEGVPQHWENARPLDEGRSKGSQSQRATLLGYLVSDLSAA